MFNRIIFIATTSLFIGSLNAQVLPKNVKTVRIGTSISTANALWVGENATDFDGDGERKAVTNDITFSAGLGNKWQIDVKAAYMETEMVKGSAGGAVEGDKEKGLSEVSVMAQKAWKSKSKLKQVSRFGLGAPGYSNSFESEEMFLATNEGTSKVYLGHSFLYLSLIHI